MPTGFEAAADIATGALLARAVEPNIGADGDTHETSCLNCGASLAGSYCSACGQKAHVHRTMGAFGHDIAHSVLHFDGKIWRTLPMLVWKPGDLTRRYIHGERARFVSPLALFLFSVFLTFAVFNTLVPHGPDVNAKVSASTAAKDYEENRKDILSDIAELQADRKKAVADGEQGYQWIDGEIARHEENLKRLERERGKETHAADLAGQKLKLEQSRAQTEIARIESELATAKAAGKPTETIEEQLEGAKLTATLMRKTANALSNGDRPESNWTFTDNSQFPGAAQLNAAVKRASENPQLLIYKLQSNAYKYSWALIPISVPFVWLLFFWRRQYKLFDHAVFVTYSLCFMLLLSVTVALFMHFSATEVIGGLLLSFAPPIHIYRQLKYAYGLSRLGALARTILLSLFAITALTLFAVLIITLGVSG
jgi:Protein of unknown function (DUF3667)